MTGNGRKLNLPSFFKKIIHFRLNIPIKNQILINDLQNEHNKLMFVLLKFVLQEQNYVDWIFKM